MDHPVDENDNNGQRMGKTEGGEHRAGRKSQIKNDRLDQEEYPTQYTDSKKR
jgi:hypothetical protein